MSVFALAASLVGTEQPLWLSGGVSVPVPVDLADPSILLVSPCVPPCCCTEHVPFLKTPFPGLRCSLPRLKAWGN